MVTGDEVKKAVQAAKLTWIVSHDCSLCGIDVGWIVDGDNLRFRSGCGCSWTPDRPCSWNEPADYINMKKRTGQWGDVAARVAKDFGIDLPPLAQTTG